MLHSTDNKGLITLAFTLSYDGRAHLLSYHTPHGVATPKGIQSNWKLDDARKADGLDGPLAQVRHVIAEELGTELGRWKDSENASPEAVYDPDKEASQSAWYKMVRAYQNTSASGDTGSLEPVSTLASMLCEGLLKRPDQQTSKVTADSAG